MSLKSVSIITGTPGRAPCRLPSLARSPSMTIVPSLRRGPDQISRPDVGPLYLTVFEAAGAEPGTGPEEVEAGGLMEPAGSAYMGGLVAAGEFSGEGGEAAAPAPEVVDGGCGIGAS